MIEKHRARQCVWKCAPAPFFYAYMVGLLMAIGFASCSGGANSPGSSPGSSTIGAQQLPRVGSTWTYAESITSASGTTSGTLSTVYLGQMAYRGGVYYTLRTTSMESPPVVQSYFSTGGAVIQEVAGTLPDAPSPPGCAATPPQVEDVPDQAFTFFGASGSYFGTETIYRCGFSPATA